MEFGSILKTTRISLGLTQKDVIKLLQLKGDQFSNLDEVTLSRWENGKTNPSLNKKCRILYSLDCFNELIFYLSISDQKEKFMSNFEKKCLARFDHNLTKTYLDYVSPTSLVKSEEITQEYVSDHQFDFHSTIFDEDLSILVNKLKKQHFIIRGFNFSSQNNQPLGHLFVGLGKTSDFICTFKDIKETTVLNYDEEEFMPNESCLFLFSDVATNKEVEISKLNIIFTFIEKYKIDRVIMRPFLTAGKEIAESYNFKPIVTSRENNSGRIQFGGKKYSWVCYSSNSYDIYASSLLAAKLM